MPSSPDQNSVAERRNRTLVDMVRSMLSNSDLPKFLSSNALKTVVYILNCVPTNDGNIGFDGYIGTWILRIYRIYRRYIGGYFYMNIDILEINKNTLKFMEILSKSVKMTLIIKHIH